MVAGRRGFQLATDDVQVLLYLYLSDPLAGNYAHRRLPRKPTESVKGVLYTVLAGLTMGYCYPQLMKSITPNFTDAL